MVLTSTLWWSEAEYSRRTALSLSDGDLQQPLGLATTRKQQESGLAQNETGKGGKLANTGQMEHGSTSAVA